MRLTVDDIHRLNKEVEEAELQASKRKLKRDELVDIAFRRLMHREIRELKNTIYWGD